MDSGFIAGAFSQMKSDTIQQQKNYLAASHEIYNSVS
jgi:hypothetical protein